LQIEGSNIIAGIEKYAFRVNIRIKYFLRKIYCSKIFWFKNELQQGFCFPNRFAEVNIKFQSHNDHYKA